MTIPDTDLNFVKGGFNPVFQGLETSRLSGRDIAAIVGVSPTTVSNWRTGRARMPAVTLVFLTLLLAHWLDELEYLIRARAKTGQASWFWRRAQEDHLIAGRKSLEEQDAINTALPADVRGGGARLFRDWWRARASDNTVQTGPAGMV